jgi:glycosyltransferase involved in cell wall biosynthesis
MSARRVLIFSDCPYFAGCESMIANLVNRSADRGPYRIGLLYRPGKVYVDGMRRRMDCTALSHFHLRTPSADKIVGKLASVLGPLHAAFTPALWLASVAGTALEVRRVLRRFRPDIVHINNGGYPAAIAAHGAVLALGRGGRIPCVYVANNVAPRRKWFKLGEAAMDRLARSRVEVFVTGSRVAGAALRSRLGGGPGQYAVIHNGVDVRASGDASRAPAYLGLAEEARGRGNLVLGVVATLEARKGHRCLLEALRILRTRVGESRMPLTLVEGRGPLARELRELARAMDLDASVAFLGSVASVYRLIEILDVLVLPSIEREDFPNVILEAMMHGKAVVASAVGGTPEQVEPGLSGLLVPPGDPAALAEALETFVDAPLLASRFGAAGAERFQERFTAAAAVRRYARLYERLLEERA